MTCDWCGKERHTFGIGLGGRDVLSICGDCYMGIQSAIFGEE
jgi:hypothetical protein